MKTQTLNRLELQRRRQNLQQQPPDIHSTLPSPSMHPPPAPIDAPSAQMGNFRTLPPKRPALPVSQLNGHNPGQQPLHPLSRSEIYAPASIASPRELAHYKRPLSSTQITNNNRQQQQHPSVEQSAHYAATSFRGQTPTVAASESGRSGRESALGNLFMRFGTFRRKARWRRSNQKIQPQDSFSHSLRPGSSLGIGGTSGRRSSLQNPPPVATPLPLPIDAPPPVPQQTSLDPEIYSTGKREVKAEEIYAEGLLAIDGNSRKRLLQYEISEELMHEGERRVVIDEQSKRQFTYHQLISSLTNWINDELSQQRIIITDLQDDLYDGQVLAKLVEKLQGIKLDIVEVTQNEATQKLKLSIVLNTISRILKVQARWAKIKWTVDGIHAKNMVEILQLLVTLALFYKAPIKMPSSLHLIAIIVQKLQGQLHMRSQELQLMPNTESLYSTITDLRQRDAFDILVESAPEKLVIVKQALVKFANRHLNKINMSCQPPFGVDGERMILDPEQFSDGLLFVFLISSLEDYFVPLGNLFTAAVPTKSITSTIINSHQMIPPIDTSNNNPTGALQTALEPDSYINTQPIEKLHNVNLALKLMQEAGVEIKGEVRAEDLVNGNLKCVLRVLYALFSRYKHL